MPAIYEEKTFENYFNTELDSKCAIYFPFGQVQEGGMGADAGALSRNRRLWRKLGYGFWLFPEHSGIPLKEIAGEMEHVAERAIRNIPNISVNLLFQYKRPDFISNPSAAEWHLWNKDYFRYEIYESQQKLLENIHARFGKQVLAIYASPAIRSVDELVSAKINGRIIDSTNFRPAIDLKDHHKNTYCGPGTHSIACSDPERMEIFNLLEAIASRKENRQDDPHRLIVEFSSGVRSLALEMPELGRAYSETLKQYDESGFEGYPLVKAMLSMSVLRELTGLQWLLA